MSPSHIGKLSNYPSQSQSGELDVAQQGLYQFGQSPPNSGQAWQQVPTASATVDQCEVSESSRVGCGEPGISPAECETLNCCFDNRRFIRAYDGPLCYYGKTVTVQCTKDGQFVLVIARDATVPEIDLDNISVVESTDSSCKAVDSNDDFAIYQFPVTACGTRIKVDGDYVVYENMIASSYEVGVSARGSITRDSSYMVAFECRYLSTAVESLKLEVNTPPAPSPVLQQGPLRVELRLANGVCFSGECSDVDNMYSSYYTKVDYPVTKVLRDPVFVEVRMLERTDPNIGLLLDRCWATSNPDPSSTQQWELLVNGCPYKDDRYLTTIVPVSATSGLQYPTHYKRFTVKMFAFVDETSLLQSQKQIFIHCSTMVCQITATESCEPICNRTKRSVSAARKSRKDSIVSSGMVILIDDLPALSVSQADNEDSKTQVKPL
ncbi:zona pellucida glycoprotein 2, like 2 [Trichomycterus rosablanca]|uniref:zona pellucida glycoprotein 2, like 2 n=1 Tax=Trichomycterus rosablanca TaxID=2290929 RepID=UPI002F35187F